MIGSLKPWQLSVVYPVSGLNIIPAMDDKIIKAVGKNDWASGTGFGERDMQFDFATEKEARQAEWRVKSAVRGIEGVTTEVYSDVID